MSKNNNVTVEIKELIQQIKNEYQEGVDFKINCSKESYSLRRETWWGEIFSPQLKKNCREKFSLPLLDNDHHLDFWQDGTNYYFVFKVVKGGPDSLFFVENGAKQEQKNETQNCKRCNQLVSKKEGWIQQWDGRKVGSKPSPSVIAYFHPHCAKKYFADKEQPDKNKIPQIKQKILRNLDKISFDQAGHLANAELLKLPYEYGTQSKEKVGVYRIKIDNEEINLRDFDRLENEKYYLEVRDAIVNNIKQNISDWEIKSDEYNSEYLKNQKSGVKVWKIIFCEIAFENGEQDWAEIEKLLKGYNSPAVNNEKTETNNFELEWLKNIFQELKIKKIVFENGKLTIEFNNSQNASFESGDNQKYKSLKNYCQKHNQKEISRKDLKLEEKENTPTSPNQDKNNHQLVIGLVIGAGVVMVAGILVYLVRKRKK